MILPSPVELRFEALRKCRSAGQFVTLRGASVDIDASTLATIEIKSKANGIIKALCVNVDSVVTAGDVLVELDKDELLAQQRGAEANLLADRAAEDLANARGGHRLGRRAARLR